MTRPLSTRHKKGELSPAVLRFAQIMQDRLDGSGRSGFQNIRPAPLLHSLRDNTKELEAALMDVEPADDSEFVTWPCADIANYAMFIALNHIFNELKELS